MMEDIFNADDLTEDIDVEAKRAGGRDGKGALPNDVWETYSAFANTDGGVILLGVSEKDGVFRATGIREPERVLRDFWNQINNPKKVSRNLLTNASARRLPAGNGRWVLEIKVPRAARRERPVFINGNPLIGTFKRLRAGDYRCREDEVRRMLAEQTQDARDARILENFGLDDLDMDALRAYRNRLADFKPDHPFRDSETRELLRLIGGWAHDRQTGRDGLTLAGLLMFGKQLAIEEVLPFYALDYRELPPDGNRNDWVDRLLPDGTWSGNLFDFYRQTILRLFRDLKAPFKLKGDRREDETPVHKALREALVNALIHADYVVPVPLLILKAPDYFEFRNPGRMRISIAEALAGGLSDCRNRNIQKMFALIGLGEKAGSGIPRVLENWKSQHYRPPELIENAEREYTLMRLRMVSLLPEAVMNALQRRYGARFDRLGEYGRLALATAQIEGFVSNARLQQICSLHPRDITLLLQDMVRHGMLAADGVGRGMTYHVADEELVDLGGIEDRGDSSAHSDDSSAHSDGSSTHLEGSSTHLDGSSTHLDGSSTHLDGSSAHSDGSSAHSGDSSAHSDDSSAHSDGSSAHSSATDDDPCRNKELLALADSVRSRSRASRQQVGEVLLALCQGRFLTLQQMGELLNRSPQGLRQRYVKPMIDQGLLERRFPQQPNHELQAYRTRETK